jgi:hypothetical protein
MTGNNHSGRRGRSKIVLVRNAGQWDVATHWLRDDPVLSSSASRAGGTADAGSQRSPVSLIVDAAEAA